MQAQPAELLTTALQALKQRAHQLLESQRSLKLQNQALAAECLSFERERVQQATQHRELSAELDALQAERDSLTAHLHELTAQRDSIQQQWETLQKTVEGLQGQLTAQSAEQSKLFENSSQLAAHEAQFSDLRDQRETHETANSSSLASNFFIPALRSSRAALRSSRAGLSNHGVSHDDFKESILRARLRLFQAERDFLQRRVSMAVNDPATEMGRYDALCEKDSVLEAFRVSSTRSSDKWESYFSVYQKVLSPFKHSRAIRLLEIGVQNGGSLEGWKAYFGDQSTIIGVDIDPRVNSLVFNQGISVVLGNAGNPVFAQTLGQEMGPFDIIIDDGSHRCDDVINAFMSLFPYLSNGGIYLVEDTHTSYWTDFNGTPPGKFLPTSLNLFKELVDFINIEHWIDSLDSDVLAALPIIAGESCSESHEILLQHLMQIESVEFLNSIVVIRKAANPRASSLGPRFVLDKEAEVDTSPLSLDGTRIHPAN